MRWKSFDLYEPVAVLDRPSVIHLSSLPGCVPAHRGPPSFQVYAAVLEQVADRPFQARHRAGHERGQRRAAGGNFIR